MLTFVIKKFELAELDDSRTQFFILARCFRLDIVGCIDIWFNFQYYFDRQICQVEYQLAPIRVQILIYFPNLVTAKILPIANIHSCYSRPNVLKSAHLIKHSLLAALQPNDCAILHPRRQDLALKQFFVYELSQLELVLRWENDTFKSFAARMQWNFLFAKKCIILSYYEASLSRRKVCFDSDRFSRCPSISYAIHLFATVCYIVESKVLLVLQGSQTKVYSVLVNHSHSQFKLCFLAHNYLDDQLIWTLSLKHFTLIHWSRGVILT